MLQAQPENRQVVAEETTFQSLKNEEAGWLCHTLLFPVGRDMVVLWSGISYPGWLSSWIFNPIT